MGMKLVTGPCDLPHSSHACRLPREPLRHCLNCPPPLLSGEEMAPPPSTMRQAPAGKNLHLVREVVRLAQALQAITRMDQAGPRPGLEVGQGPAQAMTKATQISDRPSAPTKTPLQLSTARLYGVARACRL